MLRYVSVWSVLFLVALPLAAADKPEVEESPFEGLELRGIGPAITSGRISDFAFHPEQKQVFYVATASGNLWRTTNDTITWEPIFEKEGAYAIGCVEIDPSNPLTLWVGTGENNAQRSVAYGDGVYKSVDGGKSWSNMGLADSGHISQVWIHPEDSDVVLVAAQGPLWSDGGDRGLYKTTDGGKSWQPLLQIDEHTGVNEFVVDPRNPDTIVASSYQRRRHVWVLINGGPGSGIHKTTDGGRTWKEIESNLPKDHMGRIGLAGAPSAPDTLYAIVEANDEEKGVYRSTDFGDNWEKRSDYMATSPQYYNELVVDPEEPNRLYSMNTFTDISEDGGKTWTHLSLESRHVDDHALWIDPDNTAHLYIGGDGGIFESWDRGRTWRHVRNLPITQFYRIGVDEAEPFYNVCGGTQDNNSLCAPSRTTVVHGITNADWTLILGGDGYKPQIDPTDPNIIYAQYQYGGLARYDRRTQERLYIVPHPGEGEDQYKWNWNSPLLLSPHDRHRLYYAAERLFRSDDRGDSWKSISPDLTRQLDRNKLDVMGRVWGPDTVAKNNSTSMYGSIIGISESTLQEGLIFVGTDDGLISVTEDGGSNWRTVESISGVPDMSYVDDIVASVHEVDVAYAAIDNHKRGDYKPYFVKTTDRGRSWRLMSGDLPERGSAHTIVEDHVDPNLLFAGTEFGVFFTQDGGKDWTPLKAGIPTIAVRDLEIQRRESDLVVGTFGRGIYILDDYSPLRTPAKSLAETEATLFPVKPTWLYIEGDRWGARRRGAMGSEFYSAPNPPFGAVFTYYLSDDIRSEQQARRKQEIEIEKEDGDTPYPSWDELREEAREEAPTLWILVRDPGGQVVRRIPGETKKGLHRVAWDLRLPAPDPINLNPPEFQPYWVTPPTGPLALPGRYTATLAKRQEGQLVELGEARSFEVKPLRLSPETTTDRAALIDFQKKAAELQRSVQGAARSAKELRGRIDHMKEALRQVVSAEEKHHRRLRTVEARLQEVEVALSGDSVKASLNEPSPWSLTRRAGSVYRGFLRSQSDIPRLYKDSHAIAERQFRTVATQLLELDRDLRALEDEAEAMGAPWTPGRMPGS